MKKIFAVILAFALGVSVLCACTPESKYWVDKLDNEEKVNLSAGGYVKDNISDFSQYENTEAYRTVATADELVSALKDAKYHYNNVWNDETSTYTQEPADGYTEENFKGTVHVIEITEDINLGYYKLSEQSKSETSIVEDFCRRNANQINAFTMSEMFTENGISQIKVENTSDLLVFSKNGAKLTHCGFKLTSDNNVVFRNLEFDEIWQWEDTANKSTGAVGDYDAFGWAYFKISFCGYIWIDHCMFGKSYDGQIDYSNPVYNANAGVAFRAPYGADGNNGLHISWCSFNSGSDDPDGYLYKMMKKIEDEYQAGEENYLYYNALRDNGISFEDILYGLAMPQKKGFLCGDGSKDELVYNKKLQVSFANCYFKNLEDRIPKLRGGNAVMYNCVADASQYFVYRTALLNVNASSFISKINGTWKCALVSQGIVCGSGGSLLAQNCVFRGMGTLLKNNDSVANGKGRYKMLNCSYQKAATDEVKTGSTTDTPNPFTSSTSSLTINDFSWHTESGEQPFEVVEKALEDVETDLSNAQYGIGVKEFDSKFLLANKY